MLGKSERTLEKYMQVGATARLYKTLQTKLLVELATVLPKNEWQKFEKVFGITTDMCSTAENRMLADHPEVSNDYLAVFYGTITDNPRNPVDQKVIELAKEIAGGLVKD